MAEPGAAERDPLVIRSLDFLGGMAELGGWRPPTDLPEVAFVGRSNVGKSSLLNALVRRKKFARVSNTPGRTREINFFKVNDTFVLVDLPGYGYAKVSKEKRNAWRPMIEGYLRGTTELRGIVLLLDVRRDPSDDDRAMVDFLADVGVPVIVVVTKADKLKQTVAAEQARAISDALGLDHDQTILFSSVTGEGRNELAEALVSVISQPPWSRP
jgi:GTP-binding protein